MIASWMLYCVVVGVLLGGGALALERAARPLGWATRWGWSAALLLTLAVPAATRFLPPLRSAPPAPRPVAGPAHATATFTRLPRKRPGAWMGVARLDRPLAVAWGTSSAAVVLVLAAMGVVLERRRRRWAPVTVDGVPVLVSGDTGPAVVGLVRSRIVLPRWAVEADPDARRLVLQHEQEHVRAGDPRLLTLALLVAALTPWNPAVWWQLRRLRLAVEVDCDARVLRRRADVRAYGAVLLEVGRRTVHTRLAAAAFAEPVSSLERRIRIMTAPRVRRPALRALAFGAGAAALAAAACEAPVPTQPSAGTARAIYRDADDSEGPEENVVRSPLTPQTAVARYFPQVLESGVRADEFLFFLLDPAGGVVAHERVAQGDGNTALRVLEATQIRRMEVTKHAAGELGPSPVQILWVQMKGPGDEALPAKQPGREQAAPQRFRARTVRGAGPSAGMAVERQRH